MYALHLEAPLSPSPACFVATIDLSLAGKLKQDLIDQGFSITTPAYTFFSGQKKGVSCTLYRSGKLTVQGSGKDEFISFYLEPQILGTFTYTHPTVGLNLEAKIGIDEAGKGDFFGPLCIAGVYADSQGIAKLIEWHVRDSKKMGDPEILKMARRIEQEFAHDVIAVFPEKYNELYGKFGNLNHLLAWGHARTIGNLVEKTGCANVLIDQFADERVVERAVEKLSLKIELTQRTKGEEDPVVAAASILARSAFVRGIDKLSDEFAFPLPKGASQKVIDAGVAFVRKFGEEALPRVAKLHFRTREQVLASFR